MNFFTDINLLFWVLKKVWVREERELTFSSCPCYTAKFLTFPSSSSKILLEILAPFFPGDVGLWNKALIIHFTQ